MVTRMLHIMCMSHARTFVLPPTVTSIRSRHWLRRRPKPVDDTLEWTAPLREAQEKANRLATDDPHMIHVVRRLKTVKGRPWWEKKVLVELGLDGEVGEPVLHKNCPEINELLFQIKHLIQIQPLTFPHGIPETKEDMKHTQLKINGEMTLRRLIMPASPDNCEGEVTEAQKRHEKWSMTQDTLEKHLLWQKLRHKIHMEYFKAKYMYKQNQDGKEYRYTFNK